MNLFPQTVLCNQYGAISFIQLLSHVVQPVSCPCWVISMSHTGFKQRGHFQWQYMQLPRGLSSGFLPCWVKALLPTLTQQKMLPIQTDSHACRKPHYHMSGILNLCCSRSRDPRKPCHYLIPKRPSKRGS